MFTFLTILVSMIIGFLAGNAAKHVRVLEEQRKAAILNDELFALQTKHDQLKESYEALRHSAERLKEWYLYHHLAGK
jgi:hypothetical protein